jgi:hypothetical protein
MLMKWLERIATIQRENMKRLDDDVAIMTKYLKTEGVPTAAIDALERVRTEQQQSWKTAVEHIAELLED